MRQNEFLLHGTLVFGASVVVNASNYGFHLYMTRALGPVAYGELASLLALTIVLSLPAMILQIAVAKFTAELRAVDDKPRLAGLSRSLISACAAGALLLLAACFFAAPAIAHFLRLYSPAHVQLVGVIVAVGFINPAVRGILQGAQSFANFAAATAIEAVGKCAIGIGAVQIGLGLQGALGGFALACILSLFFGLWALRAYRRGPAVSPFVDVRRLLITLAGVGAAAAILQVGTSVDVILVKHFFVPSVAGLYSAVALAGKALLFVTGFVPSLVLPKTAALRHDFDEHRKVLKTGLGVAAGICVCALIVVKFDPQLVMRIFSGDRYMQGAPYLFAYAVAMSAFGLTGIVMNYKIALHRFSFLWPIAIITVIEIAVISLYHATLASVIMTFVIANVLMLIAASADLLKRPLTS